MPMPERDLHGVPKPIGPHGQPLQRMAPPPPYYGLIRVAPRFPDGHWLASLTLEDGRTFDGTHPDDPVEAVTAAFSHAFREERK